MAKIKKKGTTGQAKNFITRTQAVRKLQVSLPDFRRLCIFKGVYPREPRNKRKAAKNSTPNTTFYYTKDIQYLLHEPLLQKFREHHALGKKIARALGKGRVEDAARLEKTHAPRMTLDHIIKERYPTFVDALRDLDDCLSMLFLFANLPSHHESVPPKTIALCQRLCLEFQHYLITTHSLRKSFLSIKGIYYQATIQGQDILWLVPYKFVQRITGDVDFRIMGTFVEFYTTLLGFVNFRLYASAGLIYPPKFNKTNDEGGAELDAFTPQSKEVTSNGTKQIEDANGTDSTPTTSEANVRAQQIANSFSAPNPPQPTAEEQADESDDDADAGDNSLTPFEKQDPAADSAPQLAPSSAAQSARAAALFSPFVLYLSRETPRAPLEFLLKSFGCARVGWPDIHGSGAFTHDEADQRITHQVVDRPAVPVSTTAADDSADAETSTTGRYPGRTYVQPQWVWDSVNAAQLQPADVYAPGAALPPHLSPFIKPKAGQYDPTAPLPEDGPNGAGAAVDAAALDAADEASEILAEAMDTDDDESGDADEPVSGIDSIKALADLPAEENDDDDDFGGFSSGAEEPEPQPKKTKKPSKEERAATRQQEQHAWDVERRKMMLPRKKRERYERAAHSRAGRDAEADKLRAKRRRLEAESAR